VAIAIAAIISLGVTVVVEGVIVRSIIDVRIRLAGG